MTLTGVPLPPENSTAWYPHYQAMDGTVRELEAAGGGSAAYLNPKDGGYYLDSFTGTDDQRLTSAIAAQQGSGGVTNMAPIILPSRPISFTQPRTMYSGLKVIGAVRSGQKNPELASGNYVGPEITLGGSITSGTSSWWNGTGSLYDVYMADFTVQGNAGASVHQFLDQPSGTLYACHFHALSFNFMRGVFGRDDRKCLMTQVMLTGSWGMLNAWACQMHIGGSDCTFFLDSLLNIGPSSAAVQTGNLNTYLIKFDYLEATVGKLYVNVLNGWRGMLLSGTGNTPEFHGGVYEGISPTRQNGLLLGPAPGSLIKITGGAATFFGTKVGQGMDNPDPSEGGLFDVQGGEVSLFGCTFYGQNMGTANAVRHLGGRLNVYGTQRRQQELGVWSGRPRLLSTAGAPSQSTLTSTYTLNHDHSMRLV